MRLSVCSAPVVRNWTENEIKTIINRALRHGAQRAPVNALCLAARSFEEFQNGVDPMMHQTILAMLGLASCALILIAFWGSDLLGNKWRGQR